MDIADKLQILADAAKYDVACTSSGSERGAVRGKLGATQSAGLCHSFTADGRCVSLLKVLMTNVCAYDCAYCSSRRSNEVVRTAFRPRELADLTIEFYRRNYIEGLFLSSGVLRSPDFTTELMIQAFEILRDEYGFRGYIHAKTVPGTSPELIERMGRLVDRLSVNIELPSQESLALLAPQKREQDILGPMRQISRTLADERETKQLAKRKTTFFAGGIQRSHERFPFSPAGQSTQIIIGATPESDYHLLSLSSALYRNLSLKRVFFSAYLPVNDDARLPKTDAVQLNREHRLYQADWLMRFYRFEADEIVDEEHPFLDPLLDPKANWAINHLDLFPIEVNQAPYEMLLRVPGIGVKGAQSIVRARRTATLREAELRKLGIAYKRARYFITCNGSYGALGVALTRENLRERLSAPIEGGRHGRRSDKVLPNQLSLFGEDETFASSVRDSAAAFMPGSSSMRERGALQPPFLQSAQLRGEGQVVPIPDSAQLRGQQQMTSSLGRGQQQMTPSLGTGWARGEQRLAPLSPQGSSGDPVLRAWSLPSASPPLAKVV